MESAMTETASPTYSGRLAAATAARRTRTELIQRLNDAAELAVSQSIAHNNISVYQDNLNYI